MRIALYLATGEETPPASSPLFTEVERRYCLGRRNPLPHLAARYAAKRALASALGLEGTESLAEVEVARQPGGAPTVRLHGQAERLARANGSPRIHLSLSHTGHYAVALVVVEGEGQGSSGEW